MATLHRFDLQHLPIAAWKNGGGQTRELVRFPEHASLDDFAWRISVADIAQTGPFSRFIGIDRHLLILQGEGVCLHSQEANIDKTLHADGEVLAFAGEADMDSLLLAGPVRDFNVMVRRDAWQAQVTVWHTASTIAANTGLVMLWQGAAQCQWGEEVLALETGQGLWWQGMHGELSWQPCSGDAKLIAVMLQSLDNTESAWG
ncbi:HutD family protein [Vitreoscilla massiliensis]|uniref:HutD family protein n=1 Tax=Vitreoscilla massiliensis TaxID=1689272 RepID=A0ABY4E5R4_9NEIS|nr:HutD family protein [Vitreoscilla massiliensis]UOO90628.1 HutD family protein [Vitreoscilla massiliensis]